MNLKVKVRCCTDSCLSHCSDLLTGSYHISRPDILPAEMLIQRLITISMVHQSLCSSRPISKELLLTSPVRPAGIVLGKFLSANTVYVISLAQMLIQIIILAAVSTPNPAIIIGNYIALLAAGAVFIAIGCFVSSLTENQLVANIATLGINVFLFLMDYAYSLINLTWLKHILYWISIFRRYNTFYVGVFSVADFFFYLCAVAVFLFLTVRVLEKKRWS